MSKKSKSGGENTQTQDAASPAHFPDTQQSSGHSARNNVPNKQKK